MPRKTTTTSRRRPKPDDLPELTVRQRLFVSAFLGPATGNASEAARIAGYSSPRQQGTENLAKPAIRAAIEEKLDQVAMTADEVLLRLSDQASADIGRFLRYDASGEPGIDIKAMKDAGKTHLIKGIKPTKYGVVIELHDAQAALEKLGRYHKLFVDRSEVSGPDGGPISLAIEETIEQVYGEDAEPVVEATSES